VSQQELNLGILAHVDAGKTTLTERLLYAAGVIDEIGSVDAGTTQTDSLALERQRGIHIKSAVASFSLGDVHVNLIDTPGHPDFIAEVERVLSVLDGAVLVLSAVEGVQPQTRILFRAVQRLRVPALLFVNKIDRAGADEERVLTEISARLTPSIVPLGSTRRLGTRSASFRPFGEDDVASRRQLAEVLAEGDDAILAAYLETEDVPYHRLRAALGRQTKESLVHPVLFGSAITGAGVDALTEALPELLPSAPGDPDGPLSASVFKIERGTHGEKLAFVRMSSGTLRVRDRVRFGRDLEGKVTAIAAFEQGPAVQRPEITAGAIGKISGLREIRIGDGIGEARSEGMVRQFPPPTFEAVVEAVDPDARGRLRAALEQLAEQDPLIDVRQDDTRREISVSLYGEVQQEVIQATLADDYGLDVTFRDTTPIYVERPTTVGHAVELLNAESNPFRATIGVRVEPAPEDSGVRFELDVEPRVVPLYLYKTFENFGVRMAEYVRAVLREGLLGWQVTDCLVTMTECMYSVPDGPPSRRGPLSTAADFRKLTPLVLMEALDDAGTVVCEPMVRSTLEVPVASVGSVMTALHRVGAFVEMQSLRGDLSVVDAVVSAARARDLQRELSRLTGGEGVLESEFVGYQHVTGEPPVRRRTTPNPLNRSEYLLHLAHRATSVAGT
jgi:ribosomal protection tetracycline resistance protein